MTPITRRTALQIVAAAPLLTATDLLANNHSAPQEQSDLIKLNKMADKFKKALEYHCKRTKILTVSDFLRAIDRLAGFQKLDDVEDFYARCNWKLPSEDFIPYTKCPFSWISCEFSWWFNKSFFHAWARLDANIDLTTYIQTSATGRAQLQYFVRFEDIK